MKRGFTLIELMIVIAALAIIAAVVIPRFNGDSNWGIVLYKQGKPYEFYFCSNKPSFSNDGRIEIYDDEGEAIFLEINCRFRVMEFKPNMAKGILKEEYGKIWKYPPQPETNFSNKVQTGER